jgi:hypothetical protein
MKLKFFLLLTGLVELVMAQENYASYKVVVRSYYEDMTTSEANSMDQIYQEYKDELTTSTTTSTSTNNGTRNLRASARELETWCQKYFPGQCNWCKTNDIFLPELQQLLPSP